VETGQPGQSDLAALRLAAIVDSSDDAIVSKDLNGIVQTWNRGAERIFGYTAAEIVGRPITLLVPPERPDEEPSILARIRRGERVDHYETVRVRRDGQRIDVSVTISPILDTSGRIIGASKIARDITERKRVEQERERWMALERAARAEAEAANRAKDEFLATLSHELRSPLNAVLGWAHVLRSQRIRHPMVERALEAIVRNAEQQKQLIEDLLDLSSIVAGKPRVDMRPLDPVQPLAAAVETIRPAAEAKQILLSVVLPPSPGAVQGDPARLQQIFWNLLANAVKFTPKGGHVEVRLEGAASDAIVTVRDSGIGIREDMLPRIFDRFQQAESTTTRRYGGLGLGLALVRQLVQLHGGQVEAASDGEGRGSTFTVRLPIMPLNVDETLSLRGAPDAQPRCDGVRVLAVDDEADALALVATLLRQSGAVVAAASSAQQAFRLLERERPDVLVSDLAMPETDGYSFIQRVRTLPAERGGAIPAVALTAHVGASSLARALRSGFDLYLTKPVDPDELIAAVARLAGRAAREGRLSAGTPGAAEGAAGGKG
jgi:PAS domain S-box-containing protein